MKLANFSKYEIDVENGTVWSYKRNRFIGYQHPTGYWQVALTDDNGKQHKFYLHRLVWMAVHGEIPEDMEINHTTEDKNMNGIHFLELVTPKENINFGTCIQRRTEKTRNDPNRSKRVAAYRDGVLVMTFQSVNEAQRHGYNKGAVAACCRGKRQSYRGYTWKYII